MDDRLTLRVLTLNIWNVEGEPARQPLLRKAIRDLRPDLVSLQEVTREDGRDQLAELLDGTGLHGVHQLDVLGPVPAAARAGTALASRWAPTEVEAIPLPQALGAECAIAATIRLPIGQDFVFMAVKPTWRLDAEANRLAQVKAIAEFDAKQRRATPTIIAGDFDATPDADCMRFLVGRTALEGTSVHYHDAWEVAGDGGPGYTWTSENPLAAPVVDEAVGQQPHARRLDYVLVGSRHQHPDVSAKILRTEVVLTDPPVSDHYGVLAEIAVETLG
ncbi:endonuclease/exonuclease/phosphatase family metal-dependent hydrolase [Amycolatopsis bartoniae]|uniref:Endonuclease/exonuclease/phosphatase domain-containing protein n=1 Tax=Amycolatopsis bartoniae TaxID=941986 RepID=A0A8H9IZ58_9PSEU|nr:endonuclease/exonuclease/phosphatase family protein [Amycolatopsis bartoniae]MBB2933531.1 endonuclease/exonuclease/phosphatase family metal-dependent hydrolase [Amycolatopsis bartoniae]TVT07628.1 endonuclease/exonuclease/phosphatase family protein [Amycolatopsis bartoniae]GHF60131.1 hypothetical protein GCM10017566_37200 [Amycolatopsis bartoniae]